MKTTLLILGCGLLLCVSILCCTALGGAAYFFYQSGGSVPATEQPSTQATEAPTLPPTTVPTVTPTTEATGLSCPVSMEEIMRVAQGDVYSPDADLTTEPDSFNLVTYSVEGNQISQPKYDSVSSNLKPIQQDAASQQAAWDLFTHLVPVENRWMIGKYLVFTDGAGNILAAVEQTDYDPALWMMEVDAADLQNKDELIFTLVHEYAHLLTLNAKQVPPDLTVYNSPDDEMLYQKQVDACASYFPGEGCSLPDSYINTFYSRFWVGLMDEWSPINDLSYNDDQTPYYDKLYAFYEKHRDQFVDDYATTDPSEDIAESFAYFVFSPKPGGNSISDQKILFFYDYPELTQLRSEILQSLCEIKPE